MATLSFTQLLSSVAHCDNGCCFIHYCFCQPLLMQKHWISGIKATEHSKTTIWISHFSISLFYLFEKGRCFWTKAMCEKASSFQLPLFNSTFTQALVSLRSDVMGMMGWGGRGVFCQQFLRSMYRNKNVYHLIRIKQNHTQGKVNYPVSSSNNGVIMLLYS